MIKTLKPCRFSGKDYSAGEVVPESAIEKKALGALQMMKIIEVTQDEIHVQSKSGKRRRTQSDSI